MLYSFEMFDLLDQALLELPALLKSQEGWNSVHVTYHAPRVERIWRQWGECRILLHRIYPCNEKEALFHPHPWPSAVYIVAGRYEHRIGVQSHTRNNPPVELMREVLVKGAVYAMSNRDVYHAVSPLGDPSDSVMVIGGPLYVPPVEMPNPPTEKQQPLSPERFNELMVEWRNRFDPDVQCVSGM